jgi:hypothetical protein
MVRMAEEDDDKSRSRVRDLLHRLAVENELLQYENTGLRDAVATKKKQKKKGKALNLQQHQEYHGGAMAWSPRSFREARRRNKVDEEEQHQEELQKLEMKEAKQVSRLYKEKLKEEKRVERKAAAEERRRRRPRRLKKQLNVRPNVSVKNRRVILQKLYNCPKKAREKLHKLLS